MKLKEETLKNYRNFLSNNINKRKYCFLNFSVEGETIKEQVIVELFYDICPITSKNFFEICSNIACNEKRERLTYTNTEINRIVKNGYIQGGDLTEQVVCKYF